MALRFELADFGGFYERTSQAAFRTALGIVRHASLAGYVTQEAYAAAFRNRDRFRGRHQGTRLVSGERYSSWSFKPFHFDMPRMTPRPRKR